MKLKKNVKKASKNPGDLILIFCFLKYMRADMLHIP